MGPAKAFRPAKIAETVSAVVWRDAFPAVWLLVASRGSAFRHFAMLYKFLMDAHDLVFEESLNRIHFVVTILTVLDLVRVFMSWEQTMASKLAALYFGPETEWLAVLFGLCGVVFAINAYRSYRRTTVRT